MDSCVTTTELASPEGVQTPNRLLIGECTPSRLLPRGDGLSPVYSEGFLYDKAIAGLREDFTKFGHQPDKATWSALADLVRHIEAMATGDAEPVYFLSPLYAGAGKTSAICHSLVGLMSLPEHRETGAVVFIPRLDEIEALVKRAGVPRDMLCVLTHDPAVNALGGAEAKEAQVLLTTHARLLMLAEGRRFADIEQFWFRGQPRAVRIFDEGLIPGRAVTVGAYDVASLIKPFARDGHPFVGTLSGLFRTMLDLEDGQRFEVPDLDAEVSLNEALGTLERTGTPTEDERNVATSLWSLSSKVATVRKDGKVGQTLLDYAETLPDDLAPMVICDASGLLRETYAAWRNGRRNLVMLKSAKKHYGPLKVHVWNRGGGKDSFVSKGSELIDGITSTVKAILKEKPAAKVLLVHHRPKAKKFNVEADVRSLLTAEELAQVQFVTWGRHEATNAYADCDAVILCGTLFYRPSYYEALGRAAAGLPSSDGTFPDDDRRKIIVGEHRHLVFQAACRGRVRKSVGGSCQPMDLYVIASEGSGIKAEMPTLFPGCELRTWDPLPRVLTGKVKAAVEVIEDRLSFGEWVTFTEVQKAIGMNKSNFRRMVRQHPDFTSWRLANNIYEKPKRPGDRWATGFLFVDPTAGFADETPPEPVYDDDL